MLKNTVLVGYLKGIVLYSDILNQVSAVGIVTQAPTIVVQVGEHVCYVTKK